MVGPSIAEVLAVAGAQPISDAFLQRSSLLRYFFQTWLKLDLTTLAAVVTIFGTISGLAKSTKKLAIKLYWWFTHLCTASVSIAADDRLNKEILNWIGDQVLTRQGTRILTARTESLQTDAHLYFRGRGMPTERNDVSFDKRIPIQYLPTFGSTWFFFERNIFLVSRTAGRGIVSASGDTPAEYAAAPEGKEPLVIMCLGRSVAPIKRFLESCRDFAEQQRAKYVTVRVMRSSYGVDTWATTILRPMRPLETVHFDEKTKSELLMDMERYLDPATRRFYNQRGIPYRRGYLLHGTPGTGKTSLSIALAGHFSLELYLLHVPSVKSDAELEQLFAALPSRCLVLLEDIDAVGMSRRPDIDNTEDDDEFDEKEWNDIMRRRNVTLSGLLNVLDGVASQEGRIVIMTSNHANMLDRALVRPGRIDKIVVMDRITPRSAELMFLRMYEPEPTHTLVGVDVNQEELSKLALEFSSQIPDDTVTPAQLQGYLLNRRGSPATAVSDTAQFVADEQARNVERKNQNRQAAARWREERKKTLAQKGKIPAIPPGMQGLMSGDVGAMIAGHMCIDMDEMGGDIEAGLSDSSSKDAEKAKVNDHGPNAGSSGKTADKTVDGSAADGIEKKDSIDGENQELSKQAVTPPGAAGTNDEKFGDTEKLDTSAASRKEV